MDDAPENSVLNAKGVPLFYSGASVNHYSASDAGPELYGSAGNDTMWGDASVDVTMYGGAGDDIYRLYSATNRVSEASDEGVDTIVTWMSYALPDNFENLKVTGNGRYAFGNDADNIVMGGDRSQTLDGGKGDDVLKGGGGADIFNIEAGNGSDLILDFAAEDTVRLNGYGITSFEEVLAGMTQAGNDVHLDLGGGETLVFADTNVGQFEESQFQLQLDRSNFQLTFSDEFNTLDLWNGESGTWDTNFWWGRENGSTLYKNEELQWYVQPDYEPTNPVNPFSTDNGVVTITAERAPEDIRPYIENYEYTSGLLTTYESFAQKYGYFEMRADMPENDGTWPAFWLLPKDQSWPPELDVVEMRGQEPNRLDLTAHTKQTGSQTEILSSVNVSDTSGFHTYGVLWTEDDLVWYFDDVEVARTSTPADMHKEMYLLANLAVGGIAGEPDDGLAVPAEMQIDYIRAYALDDLQTGVAATADSEGTF
ncbi:family 16 glycosylhydrolase [Chelativorans alearense]|uniref:family 16 glycosylhydrolase n=1 Tax=Chelativorans alearense TaxID=2681495 RepID=UPI001FEAA5AF|nr:family 16 glycosylhydrolase [Chelativorans alearense]